MGRGRSRTTVRELCCLVASANTSKSYGAKVVHQNCSTLTSMASPAFMSSWMCVTLGRKSPWVRQFCISKAIPERLTAEGCL